MVAEGLTSLFAVRSSPPDSTMSDAAASAPIERWVLRLRRRLFVFNEVLASSFLGLSESAS